MRMVTYASMVAILVVALANGVATAADGDDYAVHTFTCPPEVQFKMNWANKVGANPSFKVRNDNQTFSAFFRSSEQNGNTVSCVYIVPGNTTGNNPVQAVYEYDVHRKIISCSGLGVDRHQFTCKLKK